MTEDDIIRTWIEEYIKELKRERRRTLRRLEKYDNYEDLNESNHLELMIQRLQRKLDE